MKISFLSNFSQTLPENIVWDLIEGIEAWCETFNNFFVILIGYLKFFFVFLLISLGVLTLLKLRRIYFNSKTEEKELTYDFLRKTRIVVGAIYIILGLGIAFNYLTYLLIWILDPLPDRLIFSFIDFNGNIDPFYLNRIQDISKSEYAHEKTIYYALAFGSFTAVLHLSISLWLLLHNRILDKPRRTILWLMCSVIEGILFGFTTGIALFL